MSADVSRHLENKRRQGRRTMRRQSKRLAAVFVRNAGPGLHPDGGNLYLRVSDSGARSWLFRYARNGREHWHGLGPVDVVPLAEARERARRAHLLLLDGGDPIAAKRAIRTQAALAKHAGTTFRECAERMMAALEAGWSNAKYRAEWRSSLSRYAFPVLGSLPVA